MIGYHSFPVIAEAYRKGFRDFNSKLALDMMLANPSRNIWWAAKGYIPPDQEDQSVSKTLELADDDRALAPMSFT
jgi:putative alpha-1,2-mannosidase